MIYSNLAAPLLLVASTLVQASPLALRDNDAWFSGFIRALDGAGCSTLSNLYMDYALTPQGPKLVELYKAQAITLLAPIDASFDSPHPSVDGDLWLWFTYNAVIGDIFSSKKRAPTESRDIAPTLMSKPSFSKRADSNNQVQVIDTDGSGSKYIRGTSGSVKGGAPVTYDGVTILPIAGKTFLPTKIGNAITQPLVDSAPNGLTKLSAALQETGLLDTVNKANSITFFAPIDYGFEGYDWISKDDLAPILKNHILSPTIFSPSLTDGSATNSISSQTLKFTVEQGTTYVSCGYTKATVLRSDVVSETGVIHVIDKLFVRCD